MHILHNIPLRLKSGIIFSIFFIISGLVAITSLASYMDAYLVIPLIILSDILVVIIFLFSLHRTERRIVDGNYTIKWLIKFDFILSFYFYIFGNFFLIILAAIEGGEGGLVLMGTVIYGLPVALLIIFLFSYIPSIFFHKFYYNPKIFRSTAYIFVTLTLFIGTFYITEILTCTFGYDTRCLAKNAIKVQDIAVCERARRGRRRDSCYLFVSREWGDADLCNRILRSSYQYRCGVNIAVNTNNPRICEDISEKEENRKRCYRYIQEDLRY